MENKEFSQWCGRATEQIRYKPDRLGVYEELMAHLEDRRDACIAEGLSEEDAAQKALAAMGNADEIAPQLAKVHRPFWGYFYSTVKVLAIMICCITLLCVIVLIWNVAWDFSNRAESPDYLSPDLGKDWQVVTRVQPDQIVCSDGYLFRVADAALWELDGEYVAAIYLDVVDLFFADNNTTIFFHFEARDSQGNHYGSHKVTNPLEPRVCVGGGTGNGAGMSHNMMVRGIPSADIEWVELYYEQDGRSIVFHIDLKGGGDQ